MSSTDYEAQARASLQRLLVALLDAQREHIFDCFGPQRPPQLWGTTSDDFWGRVAKNANFHRGVIARQSAASARFERKLGDTIRQMMQDPWSPADPQAPRGRRQQRRARNPRATRSAVIASAIEPLIRALWPAFDAYAMEHARLIVGHGAIVDARVWDYIRTPEQARLLLRRLLRKWGCMFLGRDLSDELVCSLEALERGEVRALLKPGRKSGGLPVAFCQYDGVAYVNYLRGRGLKAASAFALVSELFGAKSADAVRKWEGRHLPEIFGTRELDEDWERQRAVGAQRNDAIDRYKWGDVTWAAQEYRRLKGKRPLEPDKLRQLSGVAGFQSYRLPSRGIATAEKAVRASTTARARSGGKIPA